MSLTANLRCLRYLWVSPQHSCRNRPLCKSNWLPDCDSRCFARGDLYVALWAFFHSPCGEPRDILAVYCCCRRDTSSPSSPQSSTSSGCIEQGLTPIVAGPIENMPPKEGRPFLRAWIHARGSRDKMRPALLATVNKVRQDGATTVGVSKAG
jgi:hypothetical protein